MNGKRAISTALLALIAALLAALAGAFGTDSMAPLARTAFWLGLIGWNWLKWEAWFYLLLRRGGNWRAVMASGCLVLNSLLPFEVALAAQLFGNGTGPLLAIFLRGAALGLLLLLVAFVVVPKLRMGRAEQQSPPHPAALRFPGTAIRLMDIAAILAEDHYVRLQLASGESLLLHRRFRDTLGQISSVAGAQVHRGAWIADLHRGTAQRRGNRWYIAVGAVDPIPVSRSRVEQLRALGWLGSRSQQLPAAALPR